MARIEELSPEEQEELIRKSDLRESQEFYLRKHLGLPVSDELAKKGGVVGNDPHGVFARRAVIRALMEIEK